MCTGSRCDLLCREPRPPRLCPGSAGLGSKNIPKQKYSQASSRWDVARCLLEKTAVAFRVKHRKTLPFCCSRSEGFFERQLTASPFSFPIRSAQRDSHQPPCLPPRRREPSLSLQGSPVGHRCPARWHREERVRLNPEARGPAVG